MLETSRMITGKIAIEFQVVEPGPIVKAAVESIRPTATAKGVRLIANVQPVPSCANNADKPDPAGAGAKSLMRTQPLRGVDVLVVEDEDDARLLISRVLEDGGARVTALPSAVQAWKAFQEARPGVLVTDIG